MHLQFTFLVDHKQNPPGLLLVVASLDEIDVPESALNVCPEDVSDAGFFAWVRRKVYERLTVFGGKTLE